LIGKAQDPITYPARFVTDQHAQDPNYQACIDSLLFIPELKSKLLRRCVVEWYCQGI